MSKKIFGLVTALVASAVLMPNAFAEGREVPNALAVRHLYYYLPRQGKSRPVACNQVPPAFLEIVLQTYMIHQQNTNTQTHIQQ